MQYNLKSLLFLTCLSFLMVCINVSCKKETKSRMPQQYSIEQLYNNVDIYGADFNQDETKILIGTNKSGIYNVGEMTISDTSLSMLTNSTNDAFYAEKYVVGTDQFIYSADKGGDENSHLYVKSVNDTIVKDITPWPNSANTFLGWSNDKKSIYVSSNKRDVKYFDLMKIEVGSWTPTMIYQNDEGYEVSLISASERYVSLSKSVTTDKNELYMYDTTSKTNKKISNDSESTWYSMAFEKNDSIFYFSTNDGGEFSYLVKYNINSGAQEKVYEDKWDVVNMSLSENEKYRTVFINEDGKNKILLFDHATGKQVKFPEIVDGDVLGVNISRSEQNMLLSIGSSTSPRNLYLYNITNNELKKLTNSLNPAINEDDLVKAEVVRFKSFDGMEIPAIYYKPLQADKNNKAGALVWVHGGPGGQSRVGFSNSIQYLVNHGYAVLAVNNRGSSGYGKSFYKMDNKDHSNGDLKDCIYGKKWLQQQEYIDSSAIGIYGGSYGGCMVLGALAFHPDEFKVGVNLFGVANWLRTLKSIPPYWESFRKALYDEMGDPYTQDSVRLRSISPLFNYEKINKPLLVFQGSNDVRVLKVESDEIVAGVKKNGVPVEYVLYPDEGHGFNKKENQMTTSIKTLEFLDKYLKPKKELKD
ncbi:MAG: S9 family peptidase [Saprospiraceae bacterium]|nr:S9 family peptidase [Saprospiraceae bacterium]